MPEICPKCKVNPPGHVKVVAYFANGKPVFHQLCNDCMRARWEDMKNGLKEFNDE